MAFSANPMKMCLFGYTEFISALKTEPKSMIFAWEKNI